MLRGPSVNLWLTPSTVHPIKLKLDLWLDHDVEQCILFRDSSPPNISRIIPMYKFL